MKTRTWVVIFGILALVCAVGSWVLFDQTPAGYAEILSRGEVVKTVSLAQEQEFTVAGKNTITIRDGSIAVTAAECPDGYCMKRGFCHGGMDIVCLPNGLVIRFLTDSDVDAVIG